MAALAASTLKGASSKQQLLEWAEAQPWRIDRNADPVKIEIQNGVQFSRPHGEPAWIQLTTRVDVSCGENSSVYLYQWSGEKWVRRFTLEPESPLDSIQIDASDTLVLATGWPPVCGTAWRAYFIGLYRLAGSGQKTLLEGTENANSEGDTSAHLEPNGMRVEFTGESIDPVLGIRRHVLRYVIDANGVRRADPVALSAQDFVDEWVSSPWREAAAWSDPALGQAHDKLLKKGQMGMVQRCSGAANVWQVSVAFAQDWKYFSVFDQGDHRYRMLGVSDTPCKAAKR